MRRLRSIFQTLTETGRMMVGQSSYGAYLEHMALHHPGAETMDECTFFRRRQEARYGGRGGGRCC